MKWLFKKKEKALSWEKGFVGKMGVVVSEISNDQNGNGLITIEKEARLFHFYAVTDDALLKVGEEIEVVGIKNNAFHVTRLVK
ncbi:hypothetical protein [Algoriphagus sp. NG3]|uniref:hypothetical protein n=1 Tax=Algoriphagus sp. NG3 TaxID=3097546 RepID=UPI002A833A66|nr:hypothetical protein [Algoriphagus sp. NG3]WPR77752.1 hypothetical protein SLW71_10390 [Algoriphagus sp. NG3]